MKKGHFDSKKGGNVQKTETKSWGLPLMNGGLKRSNSFRIRQHKYYEESNSHSPTLAEEIAVRKLYNAILVHIYGLSLIW